MTIGTVVSHNTPMNIRNLARFTFLSVQILTLWGGMTQQSFRLTQVRR